MPGVSTSIKCSPDNQYILVTGTYKPRVRCFDLNNLSMKFERCFDSEVECFDILSDDYSKIVLLQTDRYLEIHSSSGRHYRLRIPKPGRDLKYQQSTCDLLVVGTSPEIYRLNLERGQFLQPFETSCTILNTIDVNEHHHLICAGSQEGTVEAWDPRDRKRASSLDIAMHLKDFKNFPSISTLKFKNELQMAVGTSTGHVFLYDIRSREPMLIKDHLNQLPIKRIFFSTQDNYVYSMDSAMLKVWDGSSGKQKLFIESTSNFNDFTTIPDSGLFFFAQEEVKMQTNYVPSLGPAPRWCSFLDKLTEEIEVEATQNVYDDYKFVTRKELEELNLDHLEGSDLLKAYMHGFFIDMKLYVKAKAQVREPWKKPVKKTTEEQTERLQLKETLPKVNKRMAMQIMSTKDAQSKPEIIDNRFKAMFENEDFQIDEYSEDYRRTFKPTKPGNEQNDRKPKRRDLSDESEEEEVQARKVQVVKEKTEKVEDLPTKKFKLATNSVTKIDTKKSLMKRLEKEEKNNFEISTVSGNRQMVFSSTADKNDAIRDQRREKKKHHDERKKSIRSANFKKFK